MCTYTLYIYIYVQASRGIPLTLLCWLHDADNLLSDPCSLETIVRILGDGQADSRQVEDRMIISNVEVMTMSVDENYTPL